MNINDTVFVLVPETPAAPEKPKPGARTTATTSAAQAPPPPPPKWHLGTVIASDKVRVTSSEDGTNNKEIQVAPNEVADRVIVRTPALTNNVLRQAELAALPKNSGKVRTVVDCLLNTTSQGILDEIHQQQRFFSIARFGAAAIRSDAGSSDVDRVTTEIIKRATATQAQCKVVVAVGGGSAVEKLVAKLFDSSAGTRMLEDARRLLSWFFGDDNINNKSSFILVEAAPQEQQQQQQANAEVAEGENNSSTSNTSNNNSKYPGLALAWLPHFALTKQTILPSGESLSSSAEDAAANLGIPVPQLQKAIAWLTGCGKLWRLAPAASGFKGTEPDIVEAAACLVPGDEARMKVLVDYLSPDRSNPKAPAAQLDEKRIALAQAVAQVFCASIFPLEKVSDTLNNESFRGKCLVSLHEIPSTASSADIGWIPFTSGIFSTLRENYSGHPKTNDDNIEGLFVRANGERYAGAAVAANMKSFSDATKAIVAALQTPLGAAAAVVLCKADGKDGMLVPCTSAPAAKMVATAWAARVFCVHALLPLPTLYDAAAELLFAIRRRCYSRGVCTVVSCTKSASSSTAAMATPDECALVATITTHLREVPVESISAAEIRAIRFAVADLLPKPKKTSSKPAAAGPEKPSPTASRFGAKPTTAAASPAQQQQQHQEVPVAEIASCILKRLAEQSGSSSSSAAESLGRFDDDHLQLSVLGSIAMDNLRVRFAHTNLSHILRRLQYLRSATIVLNKACRRTVQVTVGTGFMSRIAAGRVAVLAEAKRINDVKNEKQNQRSELEEQEQDTRERMEVEKGKELTKILGASGGFLLPLIRRRKDRALREEMDERLELYTAESKARRTLIDRFFEEEPDDPVPEPIEGLTKIRQRFEIVKPVLEQEEIERKTIVMEAREQLLGVVAVAELQRDKIKNKFLVKKESVVPWRELERAAQRRSKDEQRAVDFLFNNNNDSNGGASRSGSLSAAAASASNFVMPPPTSRPPAPLRVSFDAYWKSTYGQK